MQKADDGKYHHPEQREEAVHLNLRLSSWGEVSIAGSKFPEKC